jgi:multiple sugar transport system permease protein
MSRSEPAQRGSAAHEPTARGPAAQDSAAQDSAAGEAAARDPDQPPAGRSDPGDPQAGTADRDQRDLARSRPGRRGSQPRAVGPLRRALRPYLLTLPAVAVTVGILYPFGLAVFYTLFDYSAQKPLPDFVGLQNYTALIQQSDFWHSAWVTLVYAVSTTAVETVLGIAVALLLNRSSLLGRVLERSLILPLMIAPVIGTIMWLLMLDSSVGVVNYLLTPVGLGDVQWLNTPLGAMASAIVIDMWIFTPFVALLVLAGLRSLPREPFEAADVDGASWWFTFRRLTLPMLWPYILVAVIFRFMDSLKIFDVIYTLTQGGPGDATLTLQVRAYQDLILFQRYSGGLTYMVIIWAVVFVATRLLVRLFGKAQSRAAGV